MSVIGKRYTLINICEELSGDKVTIIVFHGYREVVSPRARQYTIPQYQPGRDTIIAFILRFQDNPQGDIPPRENPSR